jgi:threonine dehydrogenase-like Zn-dependent dehydrogenase
LVHSPPDSAITGSSRRCAPAARNGCADLKALVTHRFRLDDIVAAYELFSHQRDGVLKVAITP